MYMAEVAAAADGANMSATAAAASAAVAAAAATAAAVRAGAVFVDGEWFVDAVEE